MSQLSEQWAQSIHAPPTQVKTDRDLLSAIKSARQRRDIIFGMRVDVRNQRTHYRYQCDAMHKARNKFLLAAKNLKVTSCVAGYRHKQRGI